MRTFRLWVTVLACAPVLVAQAPPTAPVVDPRGVINPFTQQPAPTTVSSGGIISISGLNFGPPEGANATGSPLPVRLGGVRVLINNQAVPLISVSSGQVLAQVPWELNQTNQPLLVQAVVETGGVRSQPARFFVIGTEPALRSADDKGYGPIGGKLTGSTLTLSAIGLGAVEPAVKTGEVGSADTPAEPKGAVRAYIGGLPAKVSAVFSPARAAEFDVQIEVPEGAQRGDMVQLSVGNRPANRLTFGVIQNPDVQFLSLPEGADLQAITGSDLRGSYVIGTGERDDNGCYPGWVFDFAKNAATAVDGCLTAANRNAVSPVIPIQEGAALVAFEGPPEGTPPEGVSAKVRILNPSLEQPLAVVTLPGTATALISVDGDTAAAVIPGTPATVAGIDVNTGETRAMTGVAIGGGQAVPGAGGSGGAALSIDLGDGLNHVLSARIGTVQGRSVVAVGDDPGKPARAKLAVLDQQNKVVETRDFPDGFVPLVGPVAAARPGVPAAPQARLRVTLTYDATTRFLYVLSRKPDDSSHGLTSFGFAANAVDKALPFPDGWFSASCTANILMYNLELSRRLALMITNKPETEIKQPCEALGFGVLELTNQKLEAVPITGSGYVTVDSVTDMNDYLVGTNAGTARQPADTLHVLDGVSAVSYRIQPPAGMASFGALRPVPTMGLLVALAQDRNPGDQGVVVFDLERVEARLLTLPDQFIAMTIVDIMPATRSIVARGVRTGNTGARYLLYDLVTTDLTIVRNPDGVAWVGGVPVQQTPGVPAPPAAPSIYQDSNPKANTISAVCFDADRKQVGVMMVRVP